MNPASGQQSSQPGIVRNSCAEPYRVYWRKRSAISRCIVVIDGPDSSTELALRDIDDPRLRVLALAGKRRVRVKRGIRAHARPEQIGSLSWMTMMNGCRTGWSGSWRPLRKQAR